MSALVQQLVAFGLVAAAAAWLIRRAWRRRTRAAVCEECPKCAAAGQPRSPLVQIEGLERR